MMSFLFHRKTLNVSDDFLDILLRDLLPHFQRSLQQARWIVIPSGFLESSVVLVHCNHRYYYRVIVTARSR